LQTLAAHRDRVALSSPQGETMPPVSTFESRNNRILRRGSLAALNAGTPRGGRAVAAGVHAVSGLIKRNEDIFRLQTSRRKLGGDPLAQLLKAFLFRENLKGGLCRVGSSESASVTRIHYMQPHKIR